MRSGEIVPLDTSFEMSVSAEAFFLFLAYVDRAAVVDPGPLVFRFLFRCRCVSCRDFDILSRLSARLTCQYGLGSDLDNTV